MSLQAEQSLIKHQYHVYEFKC